MNAIQDEGGSGLGDRAKGLMNRLEEMRAEVDGWRQGKGVAGVEGEKGEDVERTGEGGLYKE